MLLNIKENIMKNHFSLAFLGFILPILTFGKCERPDRKHINSETIHCPYLQENIYKAFAEKPGCYKELEKYKKCFFCECPISEHTTEAKPVVKKAAKEKKVIDNSLTHG
jgi:hypothetical protein